MSGSPGKIAASVRNFVNETFNTINWKVWVDETNLEDWLVNVDFCLQDSDVHISRENQKKINTFAIRNGWLEELNQERQLKEVRQHPCEILIVQVQIWLISSASLTSTSPTKSNLMGAHADLTVIEQPTRYMKEERGELIKLGRI